MLTQRLNGFSFLTLVSIFVQFSFQHHQHERRDNGKKFFKKINLEKNFKPKKPRKDGRKKNTLAITIELNEDRKKKS